MEMAHGPLHPGRSRLGCRLSHHVYPPNTILHRATSRASVSKPFATGRVLSVASPGELPVHPSFRWDGPTGRCQSHKNDTMGVGVYPNCPDRSRCGTSQSGTRYGGDTGRLLASHAALQKTSILRRKEKMAWKDNWDGTVEPKPRGRRIVGSTASRVTPLRIRCAPHDRDLQQSKCQNLSDPLDNPHRGEASGVRLTFPRFLPVVTSRMASIKVTNGIPMRKTQIVSPVYNALRATASDVTGM